MSPLRTLTWTIGLAAALMACRGNKSPDPPVHPNPNMDFQQYYRPAVANDWYPDGRSERPIPAGTVARVEHRPSFSARPTAPVAPTSFTEDPSFYTGRGPDGRLLDGLPESVPLTAELLERGEERYQIFCAPCHAQSGYGDGMIVQRGLKVPPPSYHDPRLQAMPLGYFFDVITYGRNTMKPYAAQLPHDDRWAVAAWMRVLQVSQRAALSDLPEAERQKIERGAP